MALDHQGGNSHVRWLLMEAAWHQRRRPRVGEKLAARQRDQHPLVLERAGAPTNACTALAADGRSQQPH